MSDYEKERDESAAKRRDPRINFYTATVEQAWNKLHKNRKGFFATIGVSFSAVAFKEFCLGADWSREFHMKEIERLKKALEFYATFSPRQHPEGYYEIHIKPGEGGEVRFGTRAREALAESGEK